MRWAVGGGAAQGVNHDEQFHDRLVDGPRSRLHHENVLLPDVLAYLHEHVFVGEAVNEDLPQRNLQVLANGLGQLGVRTTAEDFERFVYCWHLAHSLPLLSRLHDLLEIVGYQALAAHQAAVHL